jgi:hypothetical protein
MQYARKNMVLQGQIPSFAKGSNPDERDKCLPDYFLAKRTTKQSVMH